jgi:hypothetical protein
MAFLIGGISSNRDHGAFVRLSRPAVAPVFGVDRKTRLSMARSSSVDEGDDASRLI